MMLENSNQRLKWHHAFAVAAMWLTACAVTPNISPDQHRAIASRIYSGEAVLDCHTASCRSNYIMSMPNIINLVSSNRVEDAAVIAASVDYPGDFAYMTLAEAAREAGYKESALKYIRTAQTLTGSGNPDFTCRVYNPQCVASLTASAEAKIAQAIAPRATSQVAQVNAVPTTSPEAARYGKILDGIVREDSKAWVSNRYDTGSMITGYIFKSSDGSATSVKGLYTFNGGQSGWVVAEFSGNRLSCLKFWDFADTCRPQYDIAKIQAERERLAAQLRASTAQQRATWSSLPPGQRRQQCESTCRSKESSCHDNNFNRGADIMGYNGMNTTSLLLGGLTSDDCSGIYNSCLSSCASGP